jgi:hypothetical protein
VKWGEEVLLDVDDLKNAFKLSKARQLESRISCSVEGGH